MKNVFFRGPVRIGKSTYLRNTINNITKNTIGICSQRIIENDFDVLGYQARFICNDSLPNVNILNSDIDCRNIFIYKNKSNDCILENILSKIENNIKLFKYSIIILDEIGGFEIKNDNIMNSLKYILSQNIVCTGILKDYNSKIIKNTPQFDYDKKYNTICDLIQENGEIVDVNSSNLDVITTYINKLKI